MQHQQLSRSNAMSGHAIRRLLDEFNTAYEERIQENNQASEMKEREEKKQREEKEREVKFNVDEFLDRISDCVEMAVDITNVLNHIWDFINSSSRVQIEREKQNFINELEQFKRSNELNSKCGAIISNTEFVYLADFLQDLPKFVDDMLSILTSDNLDQAIKVYYNEHPYLRKIDDFILLSDYGEDLPKNINTVKALFEYYLQQIGYIPLNIVENNFEQCANITDELTDLVNFVSQFVLENNIEDAPSTIRFLLDKISMKRLKSLQKKCKYIDEISPHLNEYIQDLIVEITDLRNLLENHNFSSMTVAEYIANHPRLKYKLPILPEFHHYSAPRNLVLVKDFFNYFFHKYLRQINEPYDINMITGQQSHFDSGDLVDFELSRCEPQQGQSPNHRTLTMNEDEKTRENQERNVEMVQQPEQSEAEEEQPPSIEYLEFLSKAEGYLSDNPSAWSYPADWSNFADDIEIPESGYKALTEAAKCEDYIDLDEYLFADYIQQNPEDNIIIIAPPKDGETFGKVARCYSRSLIFQSLYDSTAISLPCLGSKTMDSSFPADKTHMFVRLAVPHEKVQVKYTLPSYNIYVPYDELLKIATSNNFRTAIFQALPTTLTLDRTATYDTVLFLEFSSADHCQEGTNKTIYHLHPVVIV